MVIVNVKVEINFLFFLVVFFVIVISDTRTDEYRSFVIDVESHSKLVVFLNSECFLLRIEIEVEIKSVFAVVGKSELFRTEFEFYVCGNGSAAARVRF